MFSDKYNVLARLAKVRFRMLISDYPIFKELLMKYVYATDDPYKSFMREVFSHIPQLNELDQYVFHKLIYGCKTKIVETGETIFKAGDPSRVIVIVLMGELEAILNIDGTSLIIDRLSNGAVLNLKNFFFDQEVCKVDIKCSKRSTLLLISKAQIESLMSEHKSFERQILLSVNKFYK